MSSAPAPNSSPVYELDDMGFEFVENCIQKLEEDGIDDEGIYRIPGGASKVRRILSMGLDRSKPASIRLQLFRDETLTIGDVASALKKFIRELNEPVLPNQFLGDLISALRNLNHFLFY